VPAPVPPPVAPATITIDGTTYKLVELVPEAAPAPAPAPAAPAPASPNGSGVVPALCLTEPPDPPAAKRLVGAARAAVERKAARLAARPKRGRPRKISAMADNPVPTAPPEAQAEPVTQRMYVAAKRYGISKGTLRKWCATGEVESYVPMPRVRLVVIASLRRRLGLDAGP
jgi:hypothetical protein